MAGPIDQLCQIIAEKLRDEPEATQAELIAHVESIIETKSELCTVLKTNDKILQINRDAARGYQTHVDGGTVIIEGTHYHLPNPEKFKDVFEAVLQKFQASDVKMSNLDLGEIPDSSLYNNVLMPRVVVHEDIEKEDGGEVIRRSGAILPYLVGELISGGVVDIYISDDHLYDSAILSLPTSFQKRVRRSRDLEKYETMAFKLFEPLVEEFNLDEADFSGFSVCREFPDDERAIVLDGYGVMSQLPSFLCALEHRLLCHLDVVPIVKALQNLKDKVRSQEMRANASVLLGIFQSYNYITHDSLVVTSKASPELVDRFTEFVEDLYYQDLSKSFHHFGVLAERSTEIVRQVNKKVARFLDKHFYNDIIAGRRVIKVAKRVPIDDSELAMVLLKGGYLPPLADFGNAIDMAYRNLVRYPTDKVKRYWKFSK